MCLCLCVCVYVWLPVSVYVCVCGCVCVCMCVSMGMCHLWVFLAGVLDFCVFTMVGHLFSPINISLCNKQKMEVSGCGWIKGKKS